MAAPHSAGMMMLLLFTMMCACHPLLLQSVQSMELLMTSSTASIVTAVKISLGSSNDGYPSSPSAAFIHTLIERRRRRQQQQGNGNNDHGLGISEPLKPVATVVGRIQHSMNDYFPKNHNDRHRNVTMEKDDQLLSSIDNQHLTVSSSIDNRHVKIINIQDNNNNMPNDGDEDTEERRFKSTLRQGLESHIMNENGCLVIYSTVPTL